MKTGAEAEVFGAANMTADKGVEFQVCQFDAKTDATTWSIADTDSIANWLEWEIYAITSDKQFHFKKEFSIRWIKFEAWWKAIRVQKLQITTDQLEIYIGYPTMHRLSDISELIWRMGSGDNFTSEISEWLHISNT